MKTHSSLESGSHLGDSERTRRASGDQPSQAWDYPSRLGVSPHGWSLGKALGVVLPLGLEHPFHSGNAVKTPALIRAVGWWISLAAAIPLAAQNVVVDIPYTDAGVAQQRLDLYLPEGRGFTTLIIVHGGSLISEDKRDDSIPAICATITHAGIACASVNYRLGPVATWPSQPEDVARAVAWIRHHIGERGGDSTRLVLLGHSSGCQLVSLLGTDVQYLAQRGLDLSALHGIVAMGCTLSPVMPAIDDSAKLRAFFARGRFPPFHSLEEYESTDATARVGAQTPPFLVLVAEAEQVNPPVLEHARRFERAMRAAGRSVEVDVLPGRTHYSALTLMARPDDPTLALVVEFIRRTTAP